MSYLLDKKRRRKKFWAAFCGVLFIGIIFYFRTGIWNGLSSISGEVFQPVLSGGNALGRKFENFGAYFASKKSLDAENEILFSKLSEAEARMLDHDILAAENESLKGILGRTPEGARMVLGAILSKPNQSVYDTIVVDAGAREGVEAGEVVYALGDIPIGTVAAVNSRSSKVVLFSGAGEKTQAVVSGDIFYELTGRGGGNFEMILPRDIVLSPGTPVAMPGLHPYVLATVATTISDPRDPFTKVLLASPVNIQELTFVQIKK